MPHQVADIGSNLPENLQRWAESISHAGGKRRIFEIIYSSARKTWTSQEISAASNGRVSQKKVSEHCQKLVGEGMLHRRGAHPITYEKVHEVQHYKSRILRLAGDPVKRRTLATKRSAVVKVKIASGGTRGRAIEITVDDIEQFSKVRKSRAAGARLKPISERRFKKGLQRLFRDTGDYPDWGGERDDFFTNKLKLRGRRHSAAFALKGPGVGVKVMTPAKWGKRGDQIQRLLSAPATVFLLQFEGQIDEGSIEQLRKFAEHRAHGSLETLYYGYIDRDDSLRLRHGYPLAFK
jgi:hypothetical protein